MDKHLYFDHYKTLPFESLDNGASLCWGVAGRSGVLSSVYCTACQPRPWIKVSSTKLYYEPWASCSVWFTPGWSLIKTKARGQKYRSFCFWQIPFWFCLNLTVQKIGLEAGHRWEVNQIRASSATACSQCFILQHTSLIYMKSFTAPLCRRDISKPTKTMQALGDLPVHWAWNIGLIANIPSGSILSRKISVPSWPSLSLTPRKISGGVSFCP